ncbi:hypothetical protein [Microbacterium caowuchunii]|uniref:Uncharacterized protein n=1 Tax=Microbacterium caowuchunii TaxID=2614638 RepID=A0A5N0TH29_9MICO|nr:hypothetical protein [Microbacterium caowuchunii]KAA9133758.1 hypothetical protein F6B40_08385 [Microbacterium caowuchunii]
MVTKSVRVKINSPAAAAVMQQAGVAADLASRGERISAAAGPGHEVKVTKNRDRVVVFVRTATPEAREGEANRRALTRAIDAGR